MNEDSSLSKIHFFPFLILAIWLIDPSSRISSWLIDHYFTKIYPNQIQITMKSVQPNHIIAFHDMFIIYQILQSSMTTSQLFHFSQLKFKKRHRVMH